MSRCPAPSEAATANAEWKRQAFLHGFGDTTYRHLLKIHTVHSQMIDEIQANNADGLAEIPHLYGRMQAEYLISRYEREQGPAILFGEPVELPVNPVFQPGPMTPPATNQARAVVRFDVSELGRARDIAYLELEAERADDAYLVLYRMLRNLRFRPALREGTVVRTQAIEREYSFQY